MLDSILEGLCELAEDFFKEILWSLLCNLTGRAVLWILTLGNYPKMLESSGLEDNIFSVVGMVFIISVSWVISYLLFH